MAGSSRAVGVKALRLHPMMKGTSLGLASCLKSLDSLPCAVLFGNDARNRRRHRCTMMAALVWALHQPAWQSKPTSALSPSIRPPWCLLMRTALSSALSWALQRTSMSLPRPSSLRTGCLVPWSELSRHTGLLGEMGWDSRTEKGKEQSKPGLACGARKQGSAGNMMRTCPRVTGASLKGLATAQTGESEQQNK